MTTKNKIFTDMPILLLGITAAVIFAAIALGLVAPKKTHAAPFECSEAFYQVINGSLNQLDPTSGEYMTLGGTGSFQTNGIGYNIIDNYIYGMRPVSGGDPELIRIEIEAGSVVTTSLGTPAGYDTGVGFVAGDFDHSGNLYLYSGNGGNTTMNIINVSANTASQLSLSQSASVNDLVYVGGNLYGTNGTTLFEINPLTGLVTEKPLGLPSGVHGAGWAADDNKLFFANNSSGLIYEIFNYSESSPSTATVLQGDTSFGNDGASCSLAQSPIPPFVALDDTGITQAGLPLVGNVLTNDSGSELSVTEYTQPTNGSVSIDPDGTYTYTPNAGFTGTDSFMYTVTDEYGETHSALVTITVLGATEAGEDTASVDEELAPTGISQTTLLISVGLTILAIGLPTAYKLHDAR